MMALVALVVTIALVLGRGKEADMQKVDQSAIEGSKKVRIQQGGMVNFTGLEITTGDNTFPAMTMVAIILSLVGAVGAGVLMYRRCRHVDTVHQDLEMAQMPMAEPGSLEPMEEEADGHCLQEGMDQPNTEDTRHPVMLALMDSLDE
jgi:hypothetical protein